MQPVVKRILIQGGFTAGVLALVGLFFAELAGMWAAGSVGKPSSADLNPPLSDSLRYRIPLTLGGAGFLFVLVGELVMQRIRKKKAAAKPAEPQPDDAEKLLNELLAQAEAKMALEAETQRAAADELPTESNDKETETHGRKPNAPMA